MKKIIALLMLTAAMARGQNFNYSTNLFYALTYPTNIYIGTNSTDTTGDTFHAWACKINAAQTLFWWNIQTNAADIATNTALLGNLASLQTNTFLTGASFKAGIFFPSNITSWAGILPTVTNSLATNGGYWMGYSNVNTLVSIWVSNGVPIIQQLSPAPTVAVNDNGAGLTNLVSVIQRGTTNTSALTSFTATFSQAFADTNYTAIATGDGFALTGEYVSAKTTTNCLFNFGSATGSIDWLAVHQ